MPKRYLNKDVYTAAQERIAYTFDNFQRVYVSFSGGKDSTVMLHMVMEEAIKRDRIVAVMFIDLEGQYKLTIDHIQACYDLYADHIEPYWIALPIALRNAVSVYQPKWLSWEAGKEDIWIRPQPDGAIIDYNLFPFYKAGMEFEEFVPEFGEWYAQGERTACLVGIRSDESLNRFRTIASTTKQLSMVTSGRPLSRTTCTTCIRSTTGKPKTFGRGTDVTRKRRTTTSTT